MQLSGRQRGRLSSAWRRRGEDAGQALVLTVLAAFVMIAITALMIDVSMIYLARHQAQVAADAGALGAAQDLSGGASDTSTTQDTQASSDGTTVATQNDPNSTVQMTVPYGGDPETAQAVVTNTVSLPFGLSATVKAIAVAKNNVVQNGSFNQTVTNNFIEYCAANGVTTQGPQDFSCPTANPTVGSWTVYSGGVDLNTSTYITAPSSDPNAQSLDLVGSCSYNPAASPITCTNQINGTVYEPLNTITGDTYTLKFDYSANPYGGTVNNPVYKPFSVYVTSDIESPYGASGTALDTLYAQSTGSNWTTASYTFTAPGPTTYLWFLSQVNCEPSTYNITGHPTMVDAPNCRYGAVITDVSVTGPSSDNLTQ
jgi:Flp pilus assembly protein TadG